IKRTDEETTDATRRWSHNWQSRWSHHPGKISSHWSHPPGRRHHDLARSTELLLLWGLDNAVDGPDIKYAEIAYLAMQIAGTPWSGDRDGA
ncbi:hypothetical protein, partial [Mycolicibacterium porcinum]|uniref:hypothetical protein n=1 Tax=Mycolicibacterium porcinum TaxID=39693 RepID=UPI00197BFA2F